MLQGNHLHESVAEPEHAGSKLDERYSTNMKVVSQSSRGPRWSPRRRLPCRRPASRCAELFAAFLFVGLLAPTAASPGGVVSGPSAVADESERQTVRGITISTHRGGREWADRAVMAPTFAEVAAVGANWVAIHPYAGIGDDGGLRVRSEDWSWLRPPIEEAHARGLQILIKPHLAYWGSGFSWRGEIRFDDAEQKRRFETEYRRWIVGVAQATVGADAFAVGTELDQTLVDEAWWRAVIADIRAVNGAALTYAANWTDYERVPFWDALDAIGIQAYFPLSEAERPSEAELRRAWMERMAGLESFASRHGQPVVFTELGYSRTWSAARTPWLGDGDDPAAEVFQRLCLRVALEAIEETETVVGAFLWKWFPEPRPVGRDFQIAAPGVREELRRTWTRTGR